MCHPIKDPKNSYNIYFTAKSIHRVSKVLTCTLLTMTAIAEDTYINITSSEKTGTLKKPDSLSIDMGIFCSFAARVMSCMAARKSENVYDLQLFEGMLVNWNLNCKKRQIKKKNIAKKCMPLQSGLGLWVLSESTDAHEHTAILQTFHSERISYPRHSRSLLPLPFPLPETIG